MAAECVWLDQGAPVGAGSGPGQRLISASLPRAFDLYPQVWRGRQVLVVNCILVRLGALVVSLGQTEVCVSLICMKLPSPLQDVP